MGGGVLGGVQGSPGGDSSPSLQHRGSETCCGLVHLKAIEQSLAVDRAQPSWKRDKQSREAATAGVVELASDFYRYKPILVPNRFSSHAVHQPSRSRPSQGGVMLS